MKSLFKLLLVILVVGVFVKNFTLVSNVTRSVFGTVDTTLTRSEMRHVGKYILRYYQETGSVAKRNFTTLIARYEPHTPASVIQQWVTDRWNQPYLVREESSCFFLLSAGPDRKWRTKDDIEEKIYKSAAAISTD